MISSDALLITILLIPQLTIFVSPTTSVKAAKEMVSSFLVLTVLISIFILSLETQLDLVKLDGFSLVEMVIVLLQKVSWHMVPKSVIS